MYAKITGIVAVIAVAVLPFVTNQYLYSGAVNAKYFYIISFSCLLAFIAAYLLYVGKRSIEFRRRWLLLLTVCVLFVYYAAAFSGVFPERSLWSDVLRSTGVFFLTSIASIAVLLGEFLDVGGWSLGRKAIAVSAGIFSLISLLGGEGFGMAGKFLWLDLSIPGLTFANSTFAGAYLVLALILTLIELSRSEKGSRWRSILIVCTILEVFSPELFSLGSLSNPLSFLGSARASSAATWVLLAYMGGRLLLRRFASGNSGKYVIGVWSGAWIMAIAAGSILLFVPGSPVQEKYIESSTAARILVWQSALPAIQERPLLGWGVENFDQSYQGHFDNRLYLDKNIGETWFDRAHNVIIDTFISIGAIGVLITLFVVAYFLVIVRRARQNGLLEDTEAALLVAIPFIHLLQLQTSFDTVGTYFLLAIIGGYSLWLERMMIVNDIGKPEYSPQLLINKVFAALLAIIALIGFKFLVFDEYGRQIALLATLRTTNTGKQEIYIKESLDRISSFSSVRLSSSSFIKGALEHIAQNGGKDNALILKRLSLYETYYKTFLDKAPNHYRARMNYAYLLLIKTALGEDRTKDVKALLEDSYALSPQNPLTFALDAVASLYMGNVPEAKKIMQEGIALNPDVDFSHEIFDYIEKQEQKFPRITILKLGNL